MEVLVLNNAYEHWQVLSFKKAIKHLINGKAELVESVDGRSLNTSMEQLPYPSVIRLLHKIEHKKAPMMWTKRRMFIRDEFTCQYCGTKGGKLTVDHVWPQQKGGKNSWDNCVTACNGCNSRKANKTLEECGMKLLKAPRQPSFHQYMRCSPSLKDPKIREKWGAYMYA